VWARCKAVIGHAPIKFISVINSSGERERNTEWARCKAVLGHAPSNSSQSSIHAERESAIYRMGTMQSRARTRIHKTIPIINSCGGTIESVTTHGIARKNVHAYDSNQIKPNSLTKEHHIVSLTKGAD